LAWKVVWTIYRVGGQRHRDFVALVGAAQLRGTVPDGLDRKKWIIISARDMIQSQYSKELNSEETKLCFTRLEPRRWFQCGVGEPFGSHVD